MKIAPPDLQVKTGGAAPSPESTTVPAGTATIGALRAEIPFGWDNEFEAVRVDVASFEIDRFNVTNAQFMEFVESGGYESREWWSEDGWRWLQESGTKHPWFWEHLENGWKWRGMFAFYDLPPAWPVYVTHAEAIAYAKWKGRRLMTEPEFHRAAYGQPGGSERTHPWGDEEPDHTRGNFDFLSSEPFPVGSFPEGQSAWGIHDLVGNGWEWTSSCLRTAAGLSRDAVVPSVLE